MNQVHEDQALKKRLDYKESLAETCMLFQLLKLIQDNDPESSSDAHEIIRNEASHRLQQLVGYIRQERGWQ